MGRKCSLLLIIFSIANSLWAQDPIMRQYTTRDGLPSSTIFPMIQDKDGFIWFGTDVGVTRYDGKRFQNFTNSDGLSDNYILTVKEDSKGRIWFLGFNGTVSYWLKGKIYNEDSDTILKNIRSTYSFIDFFEDNKGRLWFISQHQTILLDKKKINQMYSKISGGGCFVMNGLSGQILLLGGPPHFRLLNGTNIEILKLKYKYKSTNGYWRDKDGSVLFISDDGVIKQHDTSQKILIPFHDEFNNSRIGSITMSKDSLVWIAVMGKGVYCYDIKKPGSQPILYLKNKRATGVLLDKEGNIWISTIDDGLFMMPVWEKKVIIHNQWNGLIDNHCFAINKSSSGLLIALGKGEVQIVSDLKTSKINIPKDGNIYNKISRIITTKDDTWIASNSGFIHQNSKTGCNHFVNDIDEVNKLIERILNVKDLSLGIDKIYIASGFKILEYPAHCSLRSGYTARGINEKKMRFYSIHASYSGQIWYGTITGLRSKKGETFFDHSKEDILLSKRINSICETPDSALILATHGYGLLFYKSGNIINRINRGSGLCDDICRKVFSYKNRIYVSTPSGVSVLLYSNGKIQTEQILNTGNLLPSNDVNDVFADDKKIYVATMEGVAVIDLITLEHFRLGIPVLNIKDIKVNGELVSPEIEPVLTYDKNSLRFNFTGIYYLQPNAVNYRYRLKEDQPWQTTENNDLEFSFLPPGKYTFQLQARVQDGKWSFIQSFSFLISPPFWNTIWFRLAIIIALSFCIYIITKYRLKKIRKQKGEKIKIEKQITELEQQALQTMMNPHFIFNVMNSIQHFINANDKEAANHYLADFATLIRMNLTISFKRFIPLDEEISYLELYLSFEKLRLGDKLTYEIIVDPDIDINETTIAVMMIQPFIENAVWHGIMPGNIQGHIKISFDKNAEELILITVEDNGVGIESEFTQNSVNSHSNESHALSMTIKRLNLLGKSSGHPLSLTYDHAFPENDNKGTKVKLILPAIFY